MSTKVIRPRYRVQWYPLHPRDLVDIDRIGDPFRLPADKRDVLGVDHPGHRLERDEVLNTPSPVTGLLLQLPRRGIDRFLVLINQPARKLPAPPIRNKPMPPHQQHPPALIQQRDKRRAEPPCLVVSFA
jgi:hypothetical protein